jgi:hypothetical protein
MMLRYYRERYQRGHDQQLHKTFDEIAGVISLRSLKGWVRTRA